MREVFLDVPIGLFLPSSKSFASLVCNLTMTTVVAG